MRLVAALAVACLLAGCGIRPTGAVDAGEPATGVPSGGQVYLVDGDGQLRAVTRTGLGGGNPELVVQSLLLGPDSRERAAGLTTDLPAGMTLVEVDFTADAIGVTVSVMPDPLSKLAVAQLTCTVQAVFGRAKVTGGVTIGSAGGKAVLTPDCPAL